MASATPNISGIDTLTNAVNKGTDSSSSNTKLFDDMEAFLYLLTQQLKYQDPLDPMDTAEYTNQLVQYAQVEQSIQSNSYLETMIGQNLNTMTAQSVSYMGKVVQALSDYLPLQDGYAKFSYILETDAAKCTVAIKDKEGNFVKTFNNVDISKGRHELEWDGKDKNGNQLEDGAYILVVTATDEAGASIKAEKTVFGKVTGVAFDGESVAIGMGAVATDMNNVLAIHGENELKAPTPKPELPPESGNEDSDGNGSNEGSGEKPKPTRRV